MNYKRIRQLTGAKAPFLCLLTGLASVAAHGAEPFSIENQNPFVAGFGIPNWSSASLLTADESSLELSYSVASSFDSAEVGVESYVLDGESERWGVRYLRGLGNGWEIGIDVPFIEHGGGYLDELIIDWHDIFSLPQAGRDDVANHQLDYNVMLPNAQLAVARDAAGLGDVELLMAKSLVATEHSKLALRVNLKLPTGDADELTGTGGTDVGAALSYTRSLVGRLDLGLHAGAARLGKPDILDSYARSAVATAGFFLNYGATDSLELHFQWEVQSQAYRRTSLRALNDVAYLLSFGARWRSPWGDITAAVVENFPHPQISPDVAFQLAWKSR